jgi:DNA-binding MarR family transcriptional regulator
VAKSRAAAHEFLEPDEYEAWNAILMLNKVVLAELDAALRSEHNLSVSEFDALITLSNAEAHRLGMSALASSVMLSPAGMTHLVTRMERDGLIRREVDTDDRRKWFAVLTDDGDERLRAARRTHNEVLRRSILHATSVAERRVLQRTWRRLSAE